MPIGRAIDLGGRKLELLHTPGHSPESVSLLDTQADILFAADYVYPGSSMPRSRVPIWRPISTRPRALLPRLADTTTILCAHGKPDAERLTLRRALPGTDVADLAASLTRLKRRRGEAGSLAGE